MHLVFTYFLNFLIYSRDKKLYLLGCYISSCKKAKASQYFSDILKFEKWCAIRSCVGEVDGVGVVPACQTQ